MSSGKYVFKFFRLDSINVWNVFIINRVYFFILWDERRFVRVYEFLRLYGYLNS